MSYNRMVVEGKLIDETETHYITSTIGGTCTWSKALYRLMHDNMSNEEGIRCIDPKVFNLTAAMFRNKNTFYIRGE